MLSCCTPRYEWAKDVTRALDSRRAINIFHMSSLNCASLLCCNCLEVDESMPEIKFESFNKRTRQEKDAHKETINFIIGKMEMCVCNAIDFRTPFTREVVNN
jgi:hypothetical protein